MRVTKKAGVLTCVLTAVTATVVAPGTASASAQDEPTIRELFDQCNQGRTDVCDFHPSGSPQEYRGKFKLAGRAVNCTKSTSTRVIRWETSEGTKDSTGTEIRAGIKIGESFEIGFQKSFGHEWNWTSTKADELRQDVGPHQAVNVYAAPMRIKVRGTYELHFGSRFRGHYYWYVRDVVVDGPSGNPAWATRAKSTKAKC
ncbi:hypothetical protein [Amycolatopsis keratiniphila]|uniref:hypothetical protein n=1 Tax=Amycolatopsis keratiniphila TaxID=129921 RepID=UPI00087CDD2C|nr:hypothetical protein [Amycolatopsis keratiniphila]OLZ52692.1 hypothetical protein BS330_22625 [Amycolatopsis keratiniphila subsp. nogabecina]SDU10009.1 hypothetical protein SAMN04489733_1126 [Amycolatopsis keratiniphila]